jgi:hypothetical protein
LVVAKLAKLWQVENISEKILENIKDLGWWCKYAAGGAGGGSGWLQLAPLERGDQGGSNGISWRVVVAILAEIRRVEKRQKKRKKKENIRSAVAMCSGWSRGW